LNHAVFHLAALVADVQKMNTEFQAGQYETVGEAAGSVAQAIFG